jgi:hypothetical protein
MMTAFAARGFSEYDVVALMGAHSAGQNRTGSAFDSTPHTLDVRFYEETLKGEGPAFVRTDRLLAQSGSTAQIWKHFSSDQASWDVAFTNA